MSWEEMSARTTPCPCGKGTITYQWYMDDWNRTRDSKSINCTKCKAAADKDHQLEVERERKREALLEKAVQLAEERYLARWLAKYSGKNKKAAWKLYTGGSGYPALGTFYQHVKSAGSVEEYLRSCFSHDFQKALQQMKVRDGEIEKLLSARNKIPASLRAEPY